MEIVLTSPADICVLGIPIGLFFPVIGIAIFTFIIAKRLAPLVLAAPDPRGDRLWKRIVSMFKYAIGQYRQPRYRFEGTIHILIFAGFVIISLHSITLVMEGIKAGFTLPLMDTIIGPIYNSFKDVAATFVLIACLLAIFNRLIRKPGRYDVPEKYGKPHTAEAIFVLLLISGLMIADALFEGSLEAANNPGCFITTSQILIPGTLTWLASILLSGSALESLQNIHLTSYFVHNTIFFFFLCFLPLGKHFHVITALPNVFFMKLDKGTVKPVRWDVEEEKIDSLESFGVKVFEDFTWKHVLDFYSCADCGRCTDQCPANAVGRPLSPRFISVKAREYAFSHYPLRGKFKWSKPMLSDVFEADEIWSCTTCGACEAECPLMIEYIDKIVDLRRGMVEEGNVPQSLQKPLSALEKRGNPYGKMEKKRADWTKDLEAEGINVKILGEEKSGTLFFVDSITSYEDRLQEIAKSTARLLSAAGVAFGILGSEEKDSGNEVRRFGEEMLFMELRDSNTEAILNVGVDRIVTADPHAMNTLKHDYKGLPPVEHISQVLDAAIKEGKIRLKAAEDNEAVYVYHDPCYLGRHNEIYDAPRAVIDAVPGINRVEMEKSRDRAFCCGGGGLMLFYEPIEEKRMGQMRVEMAHEAGATVIVTACPFCMVNIEDAIKTTGLEGKMTVMDLTELVAQHLLTE